jgi:hypothetical protein
MDADPGLCPVNLQWKGTDACFDFYCPCGGTSARTDPGRGNLPSVEDGHGHRDGFFMQEFQCEACDRWWHLSNTLYARPGKFFHDDGPPQYGCDECETGHSARQQTGG